MLIIIRGLPGSGKSTLAREYAARGFRHVEADMFHVHDGVYRFNPANSIAGHSWCLCETMKALAAGQNVVVANTFTRHHEYAAYVTFAEIMDIPVQVIVATGRFQNIHDVPAEAIAAMTQRWED